MEGAGRRRVVMAPAEGGVPAVVEAVLVVEAEAARALEDAPEPVLAEVVAGAVQVVVQEAVAPPAVRVAGEPDLRADRIGIGPQSAMEPAARFGGRRSAQTEKELPQPQESDALGLLKTNPRLFTSSLKSTTMLSR